jgi:hypothetical protein
MLFTKHYFLKITTKKRENNQERLSRAIVVVTDPWK